MALKTSNIVLVSGGVSSKGLKEDKLPSVTVQDLQVASESPAPAMNAFDVFSREHKKETDKKKYRSKFAVAISSLLTAAYVTPKIVQATRTISNSVLKNLSVWALPVMAGVITGGLVSSACQKILNGEVNKDYLVSDMKDALVTSTVVRGYTGIISNSGKLFNSLIMMDYSKWVKRFAINGAIGGSYALLRGIIKPDENDKLTLNKVLAGVVEGIYLGEGARFVSKRDLPLQRLAMPAEVRKLLSFVKVLVGATVGSIAFRATTYFTDKLESGFIKNNSNPLKDETLIEHIFKGNSYPTLISIK